MFATTSSTIAHWSLESVQSDGIWEVKVHIYIIEQQVKWKIYPLFMVYYIFGGDSY